MRKGWDALSDAYRNRLIRSGVSQQSYESGTPLHAARGHRNRAAESWAKETASFAKKYVDATNQPEGRISQVRSYVRSLGKVQGKIYMEESWKNIDLYESGETDEASALWTSRTRARTKGHSWADYLYYYHGRFA